MGGEGFVVDGRLIRVDTNRQRGSEAEHWTGPERARRGRLSAGDAATLPLGSVDFEREPDKTYVLLAPHVSSRSFTDHIGLHVIGRRGGLTGPLTGPVGGRRRIVHR